MQLAVSVCADLLLCIVVILLKDVIQAMPEVFVKGSRWLSEVYHHKIKYNNLDLLFFSFCPS